MELLNTAKDECDISTRQPGDMPPGNKTKLQIQ